MKFDLIQLSEQLIEADEKVSVALLKYTKLEKEYTTRYNKLLMQNLGLSSQPLREAETLEQLKQEPIYDEYKTAVLEVKLANNRYTTIKEICSNIRSAEFSLSRNMNPA